MGKGSRGREGFPSQPPALCSGQCSGLLCRSLFAKLPSPSTGPQQPQPWDRSRSSTEGAGSFKNS